WADWLTDHGRDDEAEFIRLGMALRALPAGAPDRPATERRQRQLLDGALGWSKLPVQKLTAWRFDGPVVDRLEPAYDCTLAEREPFPRRHPVRELVLPSLSFLASLATSPLAGLFRVLSGRVEAGKGGGRALDRLFDNPHLRLSGLALSGEA